MQQETKIIECKACKQVFTAILCKNYTTARKWVDEQGKQFNGKMCPTCHKGRVAQDLRLKKSSKVDDCSTS